MLELDREFLEGHLPFLSRLEELDRQLLLSSAVQAGFHAGDAVQNRQQECNGLVLVQSGQLRALFETEDGKQITLYRLLAGDICVLTASCVLRHITFEVTLEAEKQSTLIFVPAAVLAALSGRSFAVKEFVADLVAERFSEVMWVVEQMVSRNMGQRVGAFLLEQSNLEGSDTVSITHEVIARNLGTAREVVSRVLKYLEGEGLLRLSRGQVHITQRKRLQQLAQ